MAFYTMPSFRPSSSGGTGGNSGGLYWQDTDGVGDDLFSQFLDLDHPDAGATGPGSNTSGVGSSGIPPTLAAPSSIGSASDELDFLSSSSQAHQEEMALFAGSGARNAHHQHHGFGDMDQGEEEFDFGMPTAVSGGAMMGMPRTSISDTDLPRLEGISLESPVKKAPVSDPSSPTPPNTAIAGGKRQGNKFVEALSSTIRKATNLRGRSSRRAADQQQQQQQGADRAISPGAHSPAQTPLRRKKTRQTAGAVKKEEQEPAATMNEIPPPVQHPGNQQHHQHAASMNFVQSYCEDPFVEQPPPQTRFFSTANTPQESPMAPPEAMFHHAGHTDPLPQGPAWPSAGPGEQPWPGTPNAHGWWDMNLVNQSQEQLLAGQRQHQQHFAPGPHGEMPFEYNNNQQHHSPTGHAVQDPSSAGLMIQMPPHHQQPQSIVTNGGGNNDLALTAHTYLPPPTPASEPRPSRPPRAKSSGARHMSTSPMRKTRAPSASPTRRNSRHSSGGSISSVRSASGTGPPPLPGTPCSVVKKRRSRDVSAGGGMVAAQLDVGFVNFTPSDGGVLMTGVAPSGSSKTKARREKEAVEKRRRMSEAAMKAVAAAGGDVDKLIEQGFAF